MKNLIILILFALCTINAFGYSSNEVADPANSAPDLEYKSVVKTASGADSTGLSASVLKGNILTYEVANNADGFTVTRIGTRDVVGSIQVACVSAKVIATGDTGLHSCITKGFVDFLRFDADVDAITIGNKMCPDAEGVAVTCQDCDTVGGDNDCKFGDASAESGITSLETKASGTGTNLKVMINLE